MVEVEEVIMWDAEEYLKFSTERSRPFADLLTQVHREKTDRIVDLGCGPANMTRLLAALACRPGDRGR